MRIVLVSLLVGAALAGCTKSEDTTSSSTNTEASLMTKAQAATAATATDSNGLTKGTSFVVASSLRGVGAQSTSFSPTTDCADSGWPSAGTSGDTGYAMKFLMCSVLRRPDGPDTVRGGFDRITGFLCAVGPVTYDGTTREVNATFSTACFSQNFVTTACTTITGSASTGPCSTTISVTGYSSVAGVAPSEFEKYITVSALSGQVEYTIAYKATATTVAGALMSGLPSTSSASINDAFAFHVDATTGQLRYEGRFGGNNKRHMRINLIGSIDTSLAVTNVETLSFVQGENFTNNSGLVVSVNGTPAAGRRVRIQTSSDLTVVTPTWSASNADDNTCVGETGAACTSNTGIVASDKKFFFATGSGFTPAKTWFTSNSYLGSVSDTVDMDDIWD